MSNFILKKSITKVFVRTYGKKPKAVDQNIESIKMYLNQHLGKVVLSTDVSSTLHRCVIYVNLVNSKGQPLYVQRYYNDLIKTVEDLISAYPNVDLQFDLKGIIGPKNSRYVLNKEKFDSFKKLQHQSLTNQEDLFTFRNTLNTNSADAKAWAAFISREVDPLLKQAIKSNKAWALSGKKIAIEEPAKEGDNGIMIVQNKEGWKLITESVLAKFNLKKSPFVSIYDISRNPEMIIEPNALFIHSDADELQALLDKYKTTKDLKKKTQEMRNHSNKPEQKSEGVKKVKKQRKDQTNVK